MNPFMGRPATFAVLSKYLILHDAQSTASPILHTPTQADKD